MCDLVLISCCSGTKSGGSRSASNEGLGSDMEGADHGHHMPTQDDVVRKTERITKKIQELLISAQEGKIERYCLCCGCFFSGRCTSSCSTSVP